MMDFLSVGLIMTLRLLVASKLSSYLRTVPGNSTSLLGFHFAGTNSLNPSPAYGLNSVFVFGFPKMLAAFYHHFSCVHYPHHLWLN